MAKLYCVPYDHSFWFLSLVISCGALPTPANGRKSTFAFTPGTMVKFDCDPGYVLTGEQRRWCYQSGDWNWPEHGDAACVRKFLTKWVPINIFLKLNQPSDKFLSTWGPINFSQIEWTTLVLIPRIPLECKSPFLMFSPFFLQVSIFFSLSRFYLPMKKRSFLLTST